MRVSGTLFEDDYSHLEKEEEYNIYEDMLNRYPLDNPTYYTATEASRLVEQAVKDFFAQAIAYEKPKDDEEDENGQQAQARAMRAFVHVLQAQAGVGKTDKVLREIAGNPDLAGKRILFSVPTTALGEELETKAGGMGIRAVLVRGRGQELPAWIKNRLAIQGEDYEHRTIYEGLSDEQKMLMSEKEFKEQLKEDGIDVIDNMAYGKSAMNRWTPTYTKMCTKSEIVESAAKAKAVQSITQSFCRKKVYDPERHEQVERFCPFYNSCPYINQFNNDVQLYIVPHNYLTIAIEAIGQDKIDIVIIDESFWRVFLRGREIEVDRLVGTRELQLPRIDQNRRDIDVVELAEKHEQARQRFAEIKAMVKLGIEKGRKDRNLNIEAFQEAGLTAEVLAEAITIEYMQKNIETINPNEPFYIQRDKVSRLLASDVLDYAKFYSLLKDEMSAGRKGPLYSMQYHQNRLKGKGQDKRAVNTIAMFYHSKLRYSACPILIIDADANRDILEQFVQVDKFISVPVEYQHSEVRQIMNREYTKQTLVGVDVDLILEPCEEDDTERKAEINTAKGDKRAKTAKSHRSDLHNFMQYLCTEQRHEIQKDPSKKPLLITYQDTERLLIEEHGTSEGSEEKKIEDYHIQHFNNIRGKDEWKNTTAIVVAGRTQPSQWAVSDIARKIFYKAPYVVDFHSNMDLEKGLIYIKGDQVQEVKARYFADQYMNGILKQIREAELMQAIARARLVHRTQENPCQVFILTKTPLPLLVDNAIDYKASMFDNRIKLLANKYFFCDGIKWWVKSGVFKTVGQATMFFQRHPMEIPEENNLLKKTRYTKVIYNRGKRKAVDKIAYIKVDESKTIEQQIEEFQEFMEDEAIICRVA